MEEIYIVKLKGLPSPSSAASQHHDLIAGKNRKNSYCSESDLTAEAIQGFSYLHIFFGVTILCLSVTNLCFHDNPFQLQPPLGITVWCSISFILLGFFGLLISYKRKCDPSGSILYVRIQLVLVLIVLSLTLTFAILFLLDLHGPIANQFIALNLIFSFIVETVFLLLTLFTCARVLWPGCMNFFAKNWPTQSSFKRKIIVKTNVFANGIKQDRANMIQSFGPNCVISLNMPPALQSLSSDLLLSSSENLSDCSSPTCKSSSIDHHQRNKARSSLLSESTSDLTKSLSTIYAIPEEIMDYGRSEIKTISTNSIYYNYPVSIANSTTNLLQTFPNARQKNREQLHNQNEIQINHDIVGKKNGNGDGGESKNEKRCAENSWC
ncbi:hypothetical protein SSS_10029 [Sarcoptes scabiei]|nr:hypothetical protein SSS_10029 [Sarcoptes scabiei]